MTRAARGRIRTIKPEIWDSEDIGSLSLPARLLFVGLITRVDDEGRCRDSAIWLKGQLFAYDDDVTAAQVEAWLAEIAARNMANRYEADGKRYLVLTGWNGHQKVQHPSPSSIPAPEQTPPEESGPTYDPTEPPDDIPPEFSGDLTRNPEESRPSRAHSDLDLDLDLDHDQVRSGVSPNQEPTSEPPTQPPKGGPAPPDQAADQDFETWWELYPRRLGRRRGKAQAHQRWRQLSPNDQAKALAAMAHYAAEHGDDPSVDFAEDPERWLKHRRWVDYLDPPAPTTNGQLNGHKRPRPSIAEQLGIDPAETAAARADLAAAITAPKDRP